MTSRRPGGGRAGPSERPRRARGHGRTVGAVAAVLVLAAVVLARGAQDPQPVAVQTPFEVDGSWTTAADARTFLEELDADSPRVSVRQVGTSVGGRRIDLVGIGAARPPEYRDGDHPLLVTGLIHGDELAGREAALILARDLAHTSDERLLDYLADHPVWIIPTINPDGVTPQRYVNARGVNLNRDFGRLTQPESRAVAAVIADLAPALTIDLHETWPDVDVQVEGLEVRPADARLNDLLAPMVSFVRARLAAGSYTTEIFPHDTVSDGVTVQEAAAMLHSTNLLVETNMRQEPPRRVRAQVATVMAALEYHRLYAAEVDGASAGARSRAVEAGRDRDAYTFLDGTTADPAPAAYRLTSAELGRTAVLRDAYNISAQPRGGEWVVSLAQPARPIIPVVMDRSSPWRTVDAARLATDPVGG